MPPESGAAAPAQKLDRPRPPLGDLWVAVAGPIEAALDLAAASVAYNPSYFVEGRHDRLTIHGCTFGTLLHIMLTDALEAADEAYGIATPNPECKRFTDKAGEARMAILDAALLARALARNNDTDVCEAVNDHDALQLIHDHLQRADRVLDECRPGFSGADEVPS